MIWIFLAVIVALLFAYTFDFKSAFAIAARSPISFEKIEKNKALVYAVLKDKQEGGRRNINEMHITNILGWIVIALVFGFVGKFIFGFGFWNSSLLYLVTQTIAHIVGACSNGYALIKVPKEEVKKQ